MRNIAWSRSNALLGAVRAVPAAAVIGFVDPAQPGPRPRCLHYHPADHVLAVTTLATPAGLGEVQSQRPAA